MEGGDAGLARLRVNGPISRLTVTRIAARPALAKPSTEQKRRLPPVPDGFGRSKNAAASFAMERTAIPPRVDLPALRALIREHRDAELPTITLPLEQVESLMTEAHLYRNKFDAAGRRQKDGSRARKQTPPKITLENVDKHDESPGGT
jgi:hypothetical protein